MLRSPSNPKLRTDFLGGRKANSSHISNTSSASRSGILDFPIWLSNLAEMRELGRGGGGDFPLWRCATASFSDFSALSLLNRHKIATQINLMLDLISYFDPLLFLRFDQWNLVEKKGGGGSFEVIEDNIKLKKLKRMKRTLLYWFTFDRSLKHQAHSCVPPFQSNRRKKLEVAAL